MGAVLSIDLACNRSKDIGVCLIEEVAGRAGKAVFVDPDRDLKLPKCPNLDPAGFAEVVFSYCENQNVKVLLLDGPQGWKDPRSNLGHSRKCEKLLATPGKTGALGSAKPGGFLTFARFSIELYAHLQKKGMQLVLERSIRAPIGKILLVESFPTSAWRELRIVPLPGKKQQLNDLELRIRLQILEQMFGFAAPGLPNHDQLQALVASFAGIAILAEDPKGYVAVGEPPRLLDRAVVEGFIVNPRWPACSI